LKLFSLQKDEYDLDSYLEILRTKWFKVPVGTERMSTANLKEMNDQSLLALWESAAKRRGSKPDFFETWAHVLYSDSFKGKKLLEVGGGIGIDGIAFAKNGAHVTFLDILEPNLEIIRRICKLKEVHGVDFLYLEKEASLDALPEYDFITCLGSMMCAPFNVVRQEAQALLKHLKIGGRWIELAYPKSRWEREGKKDFEKWGARTDGGAPWMEWYDLDKLKSVLAPSEFKTILYFDFYDSDFNWFDLLRIS
jgi:SAM-dependent methyltransferase